MDELSIWLQGFLGSLVQKNATLVAIVLAVGSLRLVMKPAMAAIQKFTKETPWSWDDELVNKVVESKAWGVTVFLVDWLGSIKLPKPPAPTTPGAESSPTETHPSGEGK